MLPSGLPSQLPGCLVWHRDTILKTGTRICVPSRMAWALGFSFYHPKTWQLQYNVGTEQIFILSCGSQHRTPISSLLGKCAQQQAQLQEVSTFTFCCYEFWQMCPQLLGFGLNSTLPTRARYFLKTLLSGALRWVKYFVSAAQWG